MIQEINIRIAPQFIENLDYIKKATAKQLNISVEKVTEIKILKKSVDARSKNVLYQLRIKVGIKEKIPKDLTKASIKKDVSKLYARQDANLSRGSIFSELLKQSIDSPYRPKLLRAVPL